MKKIRPGIVLVVVCYLLTVAALVWGLIQARRHVIATLGTPEAKAEWQIWKAETERQAKEPGPVRRKPVKSDEPPLLILLRDHFAGVALGVATITSFLYAFCVVIARGLTSGRRA